MREEVERLAMDSRTAALSTVNTSRPPPCAPPSSTTSNSRLVVHRPRGGRRSRLCQKVTDMAWSPVLSSYLKDQKVTYSSTVQSCLWPALTKLQSVVCVAGKEQGKTVSWVLPLLNSLVDKEMYEGLPDGMGPRAVVLCAGHVTAGKAGEALERVSVEAGLDVKIVTASKQTWKKWWNLGT